MLDTIVRPQRLLAAKAKYDKSHQFNNIYYFICRQDWIEEALDQVLDNKGSGTAGIDGQTIADLQKQEQKMQLISQIQSERKSKQYHPSPVRRAYIPKPNGEKRPLGIPTIKDRLVQCLLKMLLEPIYESDFLDCSSGFRPTRRTMDCIATCYSNVTKTQRYYWVIEGDIEGCFDSIHHAKLLRIISKRITDNHVIELIHKFLNAGIMEGVLFRNSTEGVPQGGIFSPLLANIYLNELDNWWYDKYHLTKSKRYRRRKMGLGNYILARYADDFIMLCNGTKESAVEMKNQLRAFLSENLGLTLSEEKTRITHIQDGFNFLGFHLQLYKLETSEVLVVKPTARNIQKLMHKIRQMTAGNTHLDSEYNKIYAINAVLRGWSGYYTHVSSYSTFAKLDFHVSHRITQWLADKHQIGTTKTLSLYSKQQGNHKNIAIKLEEDKTLWLFRMQDQRITEYRRVRRDNPYFSTETRPLAEAEVPDVESQWDGSSSDSQRRDVRFAALQRDHYRCSNPNCGSTQNLDVHHIIPKAQRPDLALSFDNLPTLCEKCHIAEHRTDAPTNKTVYPS